MKDNHGIILIFLCLLCFFLGFTIGLITESNDDKSTYDYIEDSFDTGDNYLLMRDLFTPCSWNDTVVIESAGEYWDEYNVTSTFWVNHSNRCWSYYFDDADCYRVAIPKWADEELWVVETR